MESASVAAVIAKPPALAALDLQHERSIAIIRRITQFLAAHPELVSLLPDNIFDQRGRLRRDVPMPEGGSSKTMTQLHIIRLAATLIDPSTGLFGHEGLYPSLETLLVDDYYHRTVVQWIAKIEKELTAPLAAA